MKCTNKLYWAWGGGRKLDRYLSEVKQVSAWSIILAYKKYRVIKD